MKHHFNPEPEFGTSNEAVSNGWLQLLASSGVLFHLESLMSVTNVSTDSMNLLLSVHLSLSHPPLQDKELKLLEDLNFVAKQLGSVRLHVVAMESTLDVKSKARHFVCDGGLPWLPCLCCR